MTRFVVMLSWAINRAEAGRPPRRLGIRIESDAMDKRYQVFVSSTYADLKDERSAVMQTLVEMDCIPAGMELFPAADEEQFEFIKRVIDDCDYYILIIGGRYGTLTDEGISYTEKEFDYAVEKGIRVLVFPHEDPGKIAAEKSEPDKALRDKLAAFREKAQTDRLVKFWRNARDLPGLVSLSLNKTIKMYPAIGWVRANAIASNELLAELNGVRKENEELRERVDELQLDDNIYDQLDLASLKETFTFSIKVTSLDFRGGVKNFRVTLLWEQIFATIAPQLLEHPNDTKVWLSMGRLYPNISPAVSIVRADLDKRAFLTIRTQLEAHELIRVDLSATMSGDNALFWSLTDKGKRLMMQLCTVSSQSAKEAEDDSEIDG